MSRERRVATRLTSGSDNSHMISQRASRTSKCLNTYVASNLVNNRAQLTPRNGGCGVGWGGSTLSLFQGPGEDNSHELVPPCLPDTEDSCGMIAHLYVNNTRAVALLQYRQVREGRMKGAEKTSAFTAPGYYCIVKVGR